jgi:predicted XRE-type DNA-binding protein
MKTRSEKIPVVEGSGNVFRDLGLADADDLQLKAELARQLCSRVKALRLTQVEARKRLALKQPDVSKLVNGRHTGFSADRLIALLNALEVDVEIVLRPRHESRGQRGTVRVRRRCERYKVGGYAFTTCRTPNPPRKATACP